MISDISISVIIPAYNAENYIERSIESALNQTSLPNEIIVVDDGSLDHTKEIVYKYGPKVRYVHQENKGPGSARNNGIQHSKYKFIAFLDADDEYLPNHLEVASEYLKNARENEKWYGCAYQIIKGNNTTNIVLNPQKGTLIFTKERMGFVYTSSLVIDKSFILDAGMFPEDVKYGEDWRTWFKISLSHPLMNYSNIINVRKQEVCSSLTGTYSDHNEYTFFNNINNAYQYYLQATKKCNYSKYALKFLKRRIYLLIKTVIIRGNKQLLIEIMNSFDVFNSIEKTGLELLKLSFYSSHKLLNRLKEFNVK